MKKGFSLLFKAKINDNTLKCGSQIRKLIERVKNMNFVKRQIQKETPEQLLVTLRHLEAEKTKYERRLKFEKDPEDKKQLRSVKSLLDVAQRRAKVLGVAV